MPLLKSQKLVVISETSSRKILKLIGRIMDSVFVHIITISLSVLTFILFLCRKDIPFLCLNAIFLIFMTLEIFLKLISSTSTFFRRILNVLDLSISIVSVVWGVSGLPPAPLASLRLVSYILDPYRVVQAIRYEVAMNKRRYQDTRFDLDLTYVTNRVIAMGLPSIGNEAMYRNPLGEVSRFFNLFYRDHYRIVNLCFERQYTTKPFRNCVWRFAMDDHAIPSLRMISEFCQRTLAFLLENSHNVIAVHCKGGKGRTGLMIGCWLLYSRAVKTAEQALIHFADCRTDQDIPGKRQEVGNPCQIRFLKHFEELSLLNRGLLFKPKKRRLKAIRFIGLPSGVSASDFNIVVRTHPHKDLNEGFHKPSRLALERQRLRSAFEDENTVIDEKFITSQTFSSFSASVKNLDRNFKEENWIRLSSKDTGMKNGLNFFSMSYKQLLKSVFAQIQYVIDVNQLESLKSAVSQQMIQKSNLLNLPDAYNPQNPFKNNSISYIPPSIIPPLSLNSNAFASSVGHNMADSHLNTYRSYPENAPCIKSDRRPGNLLAAAKGDNLTSKEKSELSSTKNDLKFANPSFLNQKLRSAANMSRASSIVGENLNPNLNTKDEVKEATLLHEIQSSSHQTHFHTSPFISLDDFEHLASSDDDDKAELITTGNETLDIDKKISNTNNKNVKKKKQSLNANDEGGIRCIEWIIDPIMATSIKNDPPLQSKTIASAAQTIQNSPFNFPSVATPVGMTPQHQQVIAHQQQHALQMVKNNNILNEVVHNDAFSEYNSNASIIHDQQRIISSVSPLVDSQLKYPTDFIVSNILASQIDTNYNDLSACKTPQSEVNLQQLKDLSAMNEHLKEMYSNAPNNISNQIAVGGLEVGHEIGIELHWKGKKKSKYSFQISSRNTNDDADDIKDEDAPMCDDENDPHSFSSMDPSIVLFCWLHADMLHSSKIDEPVPLNTSEVPSRIPIVTLKAATDLDVCVKKSVLDLTQVVMQLEFEEEEGMIVPGLADPVVSASVNHNQLDIDSNSDKEDDNHLLYDPIYYQTTGGVPQMYGQSNNTRKGSTQYGNANSAHNPNYYESKINQRTSQRMPSVESVMMSKYTDSASKITPRKSPNNQTPDLGFISSPYIDTINSFTLDVLSRNSNSNFKTKEEDDIIHMDNIDPSLSPLMNSKSVSK